MRLEKGSTPKEVFAMKKILLPVDGSKRSIRTVEMVKQLCDHRREGGQRPAVHQLHG